MAPPIVRTISRYLLRQHVAPLVFALAALTSLMLIQQVAKQLSGLLGKGLPPGVIAEVFVLSLPFIVAVTLPMAVLVAVLHVFTRLAGDNEMTALQAGGVSVARVVAPVLAGATGVALLSFLWNDQLLPRTNHELRTLQVDIARKKPSLTLKEQVINEVVPGQFFRRAAKPVAPPTTRGWRSKTTCAGSRASRPSWRHRCRPPSTPRPPVSTAEPCGSSPPGSSQPRPRPRRRGSHRRPLRAPSSRST